MICSISKERVEFFHLHPISTRFDRLPTPSGTIEFLLLGGLAISDRMWSAITLTHTVLELVLFKLSLETYRNFVSTKKFSRGNFTLDTMICGIFDL